MSNNSSLQRLLLRVLRGATLGAALLLALFIAISLYKQRNFLDLAEYTRQDWNILALLSVMLLCDLWIYRAIGREMKNPGA